MNLYLLEQAENNDYDTFDAMVVAAETKENAKAIRPDGKRMEWGDKYSTWASDPSYVTAIFIGTGDHESGEIILASFNAG